MPHRNTNLRRDCANKKKGLLSPLRLEGFWSRREKRVAKGFQIGVVNSDFTSTTADSNSQNTRDEHGCGSQLTRSAECTPEPNHMHPGGKSLLERRNLDGCLSPLAALSLFNCSHERVYSTADNLVLPSPSPAKVQVKVSPCILQLSSSEKFDDFNQLRKFTKLQKTFKGD